MGVIYIDKGLCDDDGGLGLGQIGGVRRGILRNTVMTGDDTTGQRRERRKE